ncbi:hypothetical protein Tco_0047778 [Tanacetum coccineum]
MGYLVRAYYSISPTSYYKDDSSWSADLKSKTIEDIISIGSFVEVLVLNQYVLVRKILIMNPQETQQVVARNEKWVPSAERVKISSTNIRLETTVPQKEETFQQFWYTIKKVQDIDSYEFLLANKKCIVNAEVFRTILDICSRVDGVDFTDVPDDDTALNFLFDLGYKGPLNRHTNVFMDHMHHLWRTLAAITNKCLSGKTASNDKLRKSRIDIFIQNHIKYSTNQIPPKKSRGKGSKGNNTVEESQETVDVSKESEPEPEPAKKKTPGKRRVKKKVTLSADDDIISNDPDVALELAKFIIQTKAEEAEAARKVHATHARIMTESIPESAKKKSSGKSSKKQEATDIMQALKESKKTSIRQLGTRGSNEGTGSKPWVLDESTVISATSSEGTSTKPGVHDEEKDIIEEKVILEWGDEQDNEFLDDDVEKDDKDGDADDEGDDHVSDTQDADKEDDETESDEDEIYKYKIRVRKYEDVEIKDVEGEEYNKGEEKVTDAAKEEDEKTSEAKDDAKKTELPSSSLSLSVSSGFGDQFLKLSSDSSLVSIVKDSADVDVSFNCRPLTSSDTYHLNCTTNNNTTAIELRVTKLEKDMSELKTIDHTSEALVYLHELTKKPTLTAEQESEKSPLEILNIKKEQAESQNNPQFTIKSTDKVALKEYDLKSILYQSMHANKSFNINPTNHRLYHALMEALIEDENAMDKGVTDTKPSITKETLKGKTPSKGSKTGKSASVKEPVEEPIAEVIIDDVVRDDDQPQDTSEPKTSKTLNPEWFKQPPRPPTPDPE